MHLLDSTITAPTISSSLHGGPGLIKWLGVSYAPVLGVPLVILGHLRISTTWRFRPTPTRLPAAMRSRDFTTWSTIARTRPAATASSYSRAVLDLENRCFGWRAWQDSNLRPAA
jgi:hypothetical protein